MHGWDNKRNAIWYEIYFSDGITDLLLLNDGNEESDCDNIKNGDNVSDNNKF